MRRKRILPDAGDGDGVAVATAEGPPAQPAPPAEAFPTTFIPLDRLEPSPTNPRKTFTGLQELAESLKGPTGQISPLVVRAKSGSNGSTLYEIVAGERRYRAAKVGRLPGLSCIVRDLTDGQVREMQLIENDQRADVPPLEQARGYRDLVEEAGLSTAEIAHRTGRDEGYILRRLQLLKLIAWWQKALEEGTIQLGHALLICRLPDHDQNDLKGTVIGYGGICPVKELARKIQSSYQLDLHSAPFPKDACDLVPGVCACVDCPKRTGFTPALFNDIAGKKQDLCTDRKCFESKREAFVQLTIKTREQEVGEVLRVSESYYLAPREKNQYGGPVLGRDYWKEVPKRKKPKPGIVEAVIVDGQRKGQVVHVEKLARQRVTDAGDDSYQRQQAERIRRAKRHTEYRGAVLAAIVSKISKGPDTNALRVLATTYFDRLWHDAQVAMCKRRGWEKPKGTQPHTHTWQERAAAQAVEAMSEVELHRFIVECSLIGEVHVGHYSGDRPLSAKLAEAAKKYRVRPEPIRRKLQKEWSEQDAARKKREKAAKKNKKKGKGKKASAEPQPEDAEDMGDDDE